MDDNAYIEGLAECIRKHFVGNSFVGIGQAVADWHREQGLRVVESDECVWCEEDEGSALWQSGCGVLFEYTDGDEGPNEHDQYYCHKCGKPIKIMTPKERVDAAKGDGDE